MTTKAIQLDNDAVRLYEQDHNIGFQQRREQEQKDGVRSKKLIAVAEGDSWFDYKPSYLSLGRDLLGHLRSFGKVDIYRVSQAGDTLENMVYGSEFNGDYSPKQEQIRKTINAVTMYDPDIFLFSGGGNDLAGVELEAYLTHKLSGGDVIRKQYVELMFSIEFPRMFRRMIDTILSTKPTIQIFLHGYDYPIPDGRGVGIEHMDWNFAGPWLRAPLTRKRILDPDQRFSTIAYLIDRFNDMVKGVSEEYKSNVHYVNYRGILKHDKNYKDDWANELHPTSHGFKLVAEKLQEKIDEVFSK